MMAARKLKRSTLRCYAYRFMRWRAAHGGKVADLRGWNGVARQGVQPVDAVFASRENQGRVMSKMWWGDCG